MVVVVAVVLAVNPTPDDGVSPSPPSPRVSSFPSDLIDSATESVIDAADPGRALLVGVPLLLEKGWFPSTDLRCVPWLAPANDEENVPRADQDSARSRDGRGARPTGEMASSAAAASDAIRDVAVVDGVDGDSDGADPAAPARLDLASLLDSTVRKLSTPDLTACSLLQHDRLLVSARDGIQDIYNADYRHEKKVPLLTLRSQFILT